MRDVRKWNFYVESLQSHAVLCRSEHTIETMKFIVELIPPARYNKILNIGVGEGLETKILKQLGYDPTGIISGEANIKWARENCSDIKFYACDMHDLPFTSNTFDSIYTNQVFEHAYAPFIFLLECYCVLKPGGLMYIRTPSFRERHEPNDPSSLEASYISHHHPSMFSPNIYQQMFEKAGFNIVKRDDNEMSFLISKGPITNLHSDFHSLLVKRNKLEGEIGNG
jgi:2-polyprenyl-3-methyl-5-hydroxy-6-metoxy-1,4-benzoquinol methylase